MAMQPKNRDKIAHAIDEQEKFTHASMSGDRERPEQWGQAPAWVRQVLTDLRHAIEYTVYSYITPIAVCLKDGRVLVFNVSYSPTTSNHQSTVRGCKNAEWYDIDGKTHR